MKKVVESHGIFTGHKCTNPEAVPINLISFFKKLSLKRYDKHVNHFNMGAPPPWYRILINLFYLINYNVPKSSLGFEILSSMHPSLLPTSLRCGK